MGFARRSPALRITTDACVAARCSGAVAGPRASTARCSIGWSMPWSGRLREAGYPRLQQPELPKRFSEQRDVAVRRAPEPEPGLDVVLLAAKQRLQTPLGGAEVTAREG